MPDSLDDRAAGYGLKLGRGALLTALLVSSLLSGSLAVAQTSGSTASNGAATQVTVHAKSLSVVPGALVCPDIATVQWMFRLYVYHWEDTAQDAVTHGQSELLRGQATPLPELAAYGCALIPAGTPMQLTRGNVVPVVTATGPDGNQVHGVTLPNMIAR